MKLLKKKLLILFTRNGLTAKILPQSVSMALTLCLIICLPVFILHADTKIARADTTNDISPLLAKRIISVQSEKGENVLKVKIFADGKLKDYKYFRLKMPHRFVVDLYNVQLSVDQKSLLIDSPLVKSIRIGTSYKDKVRIAFDLFPETEFHYEIDIISQGDQLTVDLKSASALSDIEPSSDVQQTPDMSATDSAKEIETTSPLIVTGEDEGEEGRAYYDLGVFAYEDGDYEDAENNLTKALEFNPFNPFYNHYLGKTYLKKERYQEAENYLTIAWKISPDIPGLRRIWGRATLTLCILNKIRLKEPCFLALNGQF